jgi:hypothetical protein
MGALKGYSLHDEIIMGELRERYWEMQIETKKPSAKDWRCTTLKEAILL